MRQATGFREQRTNFITYALDSIGLTYRLTVTPQHTALGHPSKEDYVEFDTILLHLPSVTLDRMHCRRGRVGGLGSCGHSCRYPGPQMFPMRLPQANWFGGASYDPTTVLARSDRRAN